MNNILREYSVNFLQNLSPERYSDELFTLFYYDYILTPNKNKIIVALEYEHGYVFSTAQDASSFHRSTKKKKFGKLLRYESLEEKYHEYWEAKESYNVIYYYKTSNLKVIRKSKRTEIKNRLKKHASWNTIYSSLTGKKELQKNLTLEQRTFIIHEFGSIKKLRKYLTNIDSYTIRQRTLKEFLEGNN